MTNALTIYNQFDQLQRAALALQESGYFRDVTSKAQAIVKVMAGAELGLPPFASMTGIHIIQGKPVLGANVLATLVKNDPRYNYRIKVASDTECTLEWYEDGKPVGTSGFTVAEAQGAGLTGKDNWKHYPSDMLFARAISRGARRFAPGIFGGSPVYTPDEMGADVDPDGNVVIDTTARDVITQPAQPEPPMPEEPSSLMTREMAEAVTNSRGAPYGTLDDDTLRHMLRSLNTALAKDGLTPEERAERQLKKDAIITIQNHRVSK